MAVGVGLAQQIDLIRVVRSPQTDIIDINFASGNVLAGEIQVAKPILVRSGIIGTAHSDPIGGSHNR